MNQKDSVRDIYMDYQATTPCDSRIVEKMLPYFGILYGNPHSRNHKYGWEAESAIESARQSIANAINAPSNTIIFTSGATEANNLAIKGCALFTDKKHIITTNIEHKCVLESCASLEDRGYDVTYLAVNNEGLISVEDVERAIRPDTFLVSVIAVHNEIGVIQPISEIGELCNERGIYFHTDAAQALGKIKLDVAQMKVDFLSLSAHKFYGPKGIGALYINNRSTKNKRRPRIYPLLSGGGQERGIRSGTLPTPLCVGMGHAAELAESLREEEWRICKGYSDYFIDQINTNLDEVYLNGSRTHRVPHNLNLGFRFVEGESLMMKIPDIAVSSGSACTSASLQGSYVLRALGVKDELAHTSLRFGFGRLLKMEDIQYTATRIIDAVKFLRNKSALYEMYCEGINLDEVQWSGH